MNNIKLHDYLTIKGFNDNAYNSLNKLYTDIIYDPIVKLRSNI